MRKTRREILRLAPVVPVALASIEHPLYSDFWDDLWDGTVYVVKSIAHATSRAVSGAIRGAANSVSRIAAGSTRIIRNPYRPVRSPYQEIFAVVLWESFKGVLEAFDIPAHDIEQEVRSWDDGPRASIRNGVEDFVRTHIRGQSRINYIGATRVVEMTARSTGDVTRALRCKHGGLCRVNTDGFELAANRASETIQVPGLITFGLFKDRPAIPGCLHQQRCGFPTRFPQGRGVPGANYKKVFQQFEHGHVDLVVDTSPNYGDTPTGIIKRNIDRRTWRHGPIPSA